MVVWECILRGKNADIELFAKQVSVFFNSNTSFSEIGTEIQPTDL
jgi:hypothetical protein